MSKKNMAPLEAARRAELVGLDIADLQKMAKQELNKARNREQRLVKSTSGKSEKLSYSAKIAESIIEPLKTKSGNISTATKGKNKDQLINVIIRAEKFNRAATSPKANKKAIKDEIEARKKGSGGDDYDEEKHERRKRWWKLAHDLGLFDYYADSDPTGTEEDIYSMITEAEDRDYTDDDFMNMIANKIIEKISAESGFTDPGDNDLNFSGENFDFNGYRIV